MTKTEDQFINPDGHRDYEAEARVELLKQYREAPDSEAIDLSKWLTAQAFRIKAENIDIRERFSEFIDAIWAVMYPNREFGDWEYPGQVIRFLEEDLKRDRAGKDNRGE